MPMVYSNNLNTVSNWTRTHIAASANVPVFETIGINTTKSKLTDEEVYLQASTVLNLGASGVIFFSHTPMEHSWLKKVSKLKLQTRVLEY